VRDNPSAIERLLVERICMTWLALQAAEQGYLRKLDEGLSFAGVDFYDRHPNAANRRHLAAIRSLAQVRRLQLPPVGQLNIGAQQVSVANARYGATSGENATRTLGEGLGGRLVSMVTPEGAYMEPNARWLIPEGEALPPAIATEYRHTIICGWQSAERMAADSSRIQCRRVRGLVCRRSCSSRSTVSGASVPVSQRHSNGVLASSHLRRTRSWSIYFSTRCWTGWKRL